MTKVTILSGKPTREDIDRIIRENVRSRLTRRNTPEHGRHGVYLFSGVDKAVDAIMQLIEGSDEVEEQGRVAGEQQDAHP